ncbi:MAG TPA: hypothetical protein VGB82_02925 [Alphaproteobacteria bacterium]
MTRQTAIARVLRNVAPLTAAAVLLASGAAFAQVGTMNGGTMSPNLGMPSMSPSLPPVGGTNIPMGASGLGTGGLSPLTTPGFSSSSPSFPGTSGLGVGAGTSLSMGSGLSMGSSSSLGTGLSPNLTPNGLAPGFPTPSSPAFGFPSQTPGGLGVGTTVVGGRNPNAARQFPGLPGQVP